MKEAVIHRRHCSTKFEATKNSTMPATMAIVASGYEDDHELIPERDPVRFVGDLNGVAEIPLEEVETQRQRDLELIDQDEEVDVDAGVEVLPHDDRSSR